MSSSNPFGSASSESQRRGLAYPLGFLIALAPVVAFVEHGSNQVITSYSKKRQALEARAPELEVVITGPSGALHGVDPSRFQANALNLADVSQSIYYDTAIVQSHLSQLKKLRLLILVVGLFSFEMSLGESPEYWRQFLYLHNWQIPLEVDGHSLDPRRRFASLLYPPWERVHAALGESPDLVPEIDQNGFAVLAVEKSDVTADNAAERAAYHAKIMRPDFIAANERRFAKLLQAAQGGKIAAAFVILPVHPLYLGRFDPAARAREHAVLARLAVQYGAKVFDYSGDARFKSDHFRDTDHLNAAGAEKISNILDSDVVRPALLGASSKAEPPP